MCVVCGTVYLLQLLERMQVFLVVTCSNPGEFLPRQYFPHTWRHKSKLSPIHTHHTNVHTPIHNGPLVLARFGSTTMIPAIQSIHKRILVLTQKGQNTSVMHTLTHPPIAHIETRLRRFISNSFKVVWFPPSWYTPGRAFGSRLGGNLLGAKRGFRFVSVI